MAKLCPQRARASRLITADSGHSAESGTALAIYRDTLSCGLVRADGVPCRSWGGARNRADRVSEYLTARQCEGMIAAADFAGRIGLPFNRHWTVHYERAGIAEYDGARFVGHLLRLAAAYARRAGGELAAVWVRENGDGKGGHVHILMHLPAGLSLRNRTRRWIVAAGGAYRRNVSKVRPIGGRLASAESGGNHYRLNADIVRAYLLKGASEETGLVLGLKRSGEGAPIIGKRAGWTQNIGRGARGRLEADAGPSQPRSPK